MSSRSRKPSARSEAPHDLPASDANQPVDDVANLPALNDAARSDPSADSSDDRESVHYDTHILTRIQDGLEEYLLDGERVYTQDEVAAAAGVTRERADRLWVSMGFALDPDPNARMFTAADARALRAIAGFVERGVLSPEGEVAAARALGQAMSRIAEWQVSLLSTHILEELAGSGATTAEQTRTQVRDLAAEVIPVVEALQTYVWRRHVASTTGRNVGAPTDDLAGRTLVVGFADIVGYTSLTRRIGARDLSALLERFEFTTTAIITKHHGWVVKNVGDEVMFAFENPAAAAEAALQIQEDVFADESDPELRVGLALGSALVRYGDLYGSVVNTAARLTSSARPGTVLVDKPLAEELDGNSAFRVKSLRPKKVRGIARLDLSVLRRRD
ncbi:MAG: adenylate/guanylate cyclase domain-containing protein [Rhodococcus sp.]|nr:adenylate/guanylate cyclase domain-containing protein [Rhodococcus sp. (in: high G+C Gram-positive bacteria)]